MKQKEMFLKFLLLEKIYVATLWHPLSTLVFLFFLSLVSIVLFLFLSLQISLAHILSLSTTNQSYGTFFNYSISLSLSLSLSPLLSLFLPLYLYFLLTTFYSGLILITTFSKSKWKTFCLRFSNEFFSIAFYQLMVILS